MINTIHQHLTETYPTLHITTPQPNNFFIYHPNHPNKLYIIYHPKPNQIEISPYSALTPRLDHTTIDLQDPDSIQQLEQLIQNHLKP